MDWTWWEWGSVLLLWGLQVYWLIEDELQLQREWDFWRGR